MKLDTDTSPITGNLFLLKYQGVAEKLIRMMYDNGLPYRQIKPYVKYLKIDELPILKDIGITELTQGDYTFSDKQILSMAVSSLPCKLDPLTEAKRQEIIKRIYEPKTIEELLAYQNRTYYHIVPYDSSTPFLSISVPTHILNYLGAKHAYGKLTEDSGYTFAVYAELKEEYKELSHRKIDSIPILSEDLDIQAIEEYCCLPPEETRDLIKNPELLIFYDNLCQSYKDVEAARNFYDQSSYTDSLYLLAIIGDAKLAAIFGE
jgi:hypothetical protein